MLNQVLYLARWLGPWASMSKKPDFSVLRKTVRIPATRAGERSFDAWFYLPTRRPVEGAFIMSPGLHYLGAADHRMRRLATVLASSGIAVFSPFLRDYLDLKVTPQSVEDLQRAFRVLIRRPELPEGMRPGVFSISFGSLLALRLISEPSLRDLVGGAVVFGGYGVWDETIRFCLTGEVDGVVTMKRDVLNQPVVYMNLLEDFVAPPRDPRPVMDAWTRTIHATWGRDEFKRGDRLIELAHQIAPKVPEAQRSLFLSGVGANEDHQEALEALDRSEARLKAFVDPRPHLHRVRCPVYLVHGVDDDVIPVNQLDRLQEAFPASAEVHTYKTGMYSHSNSQQDFGEQIPALASELNTMIQMMLALVRASSDMGRR